MKIEQLTERGNVLLTNELNLHAYLKLEGENEWLEISFRDENYPALNVSTVTATDEELAGHINNEFGGWQVRKCQVGGVQITEEGYVKEKDD
jgi:hypothetical protein